MYISMINLNIDNLKNNIGTLIFNNYSLLRFIFSLLGKCLILCRKLYRSIHEDGKAQK